VLPDHLDIKTTFLNGEIPEYESFFARLHPVLEYQVGHSHYTDSLYYTTTQYPSLFSSKCTTPLHHLLAAFHQHLCRQPGHCGNTVCRPARQKHHAEHFCDDFSAFTAFFRRRCRPTGADSWHDVSGHRSGLGQY